MSRNMEDRRIQKTKQLLQSTLLHLLEEKTFEKLVQEEDIDYSVEAVITNYNKDVLESHSKFKLYEGYIHCSGLEYYTPFTQNYIKR